MDSDAAHTHARLAGAGARSGGLLDQLVAGGSARSLRLQHPARAVKARHPRPVCY